jgi:hypothetical protein
VADKHPYSPTPGGISAAINQLRKSFPKVVEAETLKKLSIAPKNESYVISVLRYIGAIDTDGNKTDTASAVFTKPDDEFRTDFGRMVRDAYSDLFELHGDDAWTLSHEKLKAYFRSTDQTSDLVGRLQANTFQLLASFAGHISPSVPSTSKTSAKTSKPQNSSKSKPKATATPAVGSMTSGGGEGSSGGKNDFGLTVRIEVNLPAGGDQETYDKIFRSIRENLLTNAK